MKPRLLISRTAVALRFLCDMGSGGGPGLDRSSWAGAANLRIGSDSTNERAREPHLSDGQMGENA